jgi:hypothetical protein
MNPTLAFPTPHRYWRVGLLYLLFLASPPACGDGATSGLSGGDAGVDAPSGSPVSDSLASDSGGDLVDGEDTAPPDAAPLPDGVVDDSGGADAEPQPRPGLLQEVGGDPNFAVAPNGWFRGDLHYHSDYSEDAKEQGGDPIDVVLDIADAYRHPDFVGAFPHLDGNGLDFIAITDHRTDLGIFDPLFTHERLILLPGEEYGGQGHAGIWGIERHISHEPKPGQTQDARHAEAMAEAHAMGAVFSVNHPVQDNNWVWNTDAIDAIEVSNGPWAGFYLGSSLETLEADIASGVENPYIRDARDNGGPGNNDMALRFWQNHLTAGRHVAVVGGSDRHMLVPAALPTTYVGKPSGASFADLEGPALGADGILEGIRQRKTFVSRSPFGPQVDLVAVGEDGVEWPLGSELEGSGPYRIRCRVSRAKGGVLRLIAGPIKPPGPDGRFSAEPTVVAEEPIAFELVEGEVVWQPPADGGWLHALVLEPLVVQELTPTLQAALELFQVPKESDALLAMAEAILPMVDPNVVLNPAACDPKSWDPRKPQCMTVDSITLATFYLPDEVVRLLNIYYEGGKPTEWCFGAVTSAFLHRGESERSQR